MYINVVSDIIITLIVITQWDSIDLIMVSVLFTFSKMFPFLNWNRDMHPLTISTSKYKMLPFDNHRKWLLCITCHLICRSN